MAKEKIKYWDINHILKIPASYYVIFGKRSNGKTYGTLEYGLKQYFNDGSEIAYIRRWDDDLKGNKGGTLFNPLIPVIKKLSNGEWNDTRYMSRAWYFIHRDKDGNIDKEDINPFAYAFALTTWEHYKSTNYPKVNTIVFDEFLTREFYLEDEFIHFQNVLSTIIRLRDNVKIFMLGNTVNKFSPYFKEMGLKNVYKMEQGTIDTYRYGESGLVVAVEYCSELNKKLKANKYFAFDNPRLEMITNGKWEIDIYPHFPMDYKPVLPKEIKYIFFIIYEDNILQCEIIKKPDTVFLFIHRKTTPIKENNTNLVYSLETNPKRNYRRKLTRGISPIERYILNLFARDKVFYQDNEIGEIMRNYLYWCKSTAL